MQGLELKIKEIEKAERKPNNGIVGIHSKKWKTWLRKLNNLTKLVAFIINPTLYLCFILFYFTAEWEELKI